MAIAQVQVLHAVLKSGIRWRVTLYCDSAAGALVRFEKTGKGGRLLHQQLARWSPLNRAASRIGPCPLRGSLTSPRPDARVLRCGLHGPSHISRRAYLQSLGSQALVDLSDCCCFRSLPRLGELVDRILFERQPAQAPLPLDPEILEVLPS
jgi:hypothetical protein